MADTRGISVGPGWLLRHADTLLEVIENHQITVPGIPAGLTGGGVEEVVFCAPADITLVAMYVTPNVISTVGAGTIINKGTANAGTITMATNTTASVSAFERVAFSMSTASGALELDEGEYMTWKRGTATATTCPVSAMIEVAYYIRRTKRDGS